MEINMDEYRTILFQGKLGHLVRGRLLGHLVRGRNQGKYFVGRPWLHRGLLRSCRNYLSTLVLRDLAPVM